MELSELGGWPVGGVPTVNGPYNFKDELVKLLALQEMPLVSVFVQPDAFDTSKYTLFVS